MKSLRKLNIFRSNKHHQQKEDKENLDASYHVRFEDNAKHSKQAPKRRRSITDLSNPASAYHVPTQPRTHRPTRSCYDQPTNEPPSSSDDDQATLVDDRASSYRMMKPRKKVTYRLQQQKFQIDLNGMQTSSEYGSGGSPVSDTFEAHLGKERVYYRDHDNRVDYWKLKYRHYKTLSTELKNEVARLKDREKTYMVQQNFYKDVNSELNALRKQNNELSRQIQEINDFRNPRQNHYGMHQQAYPMMPPFSQILGPVNPLLSLDAGEKLVSHGQLPSGRYSESSSIGVHDRFDESDELKDFRKNQAPSSDDTFDNRLTISTSASSLEQARRQVATEASPPAHERSISLTILTDEGYNTNQSNQTLAASNNNSEQKATIDSQTTPVKPATHRRKARLRSTGSL